MKINYLFLVAIFIAISNNLFAMNIKDSIIVNKSYSGPDYFQKGREISEDELYALLHFNPRSEPEINKYETNKLFGKILVVAGILFGAVPIEESFRYSDNKMPIPSSQLYLAMGSGFAIFTGAIVWILAPSHLDKAIKLFNANLSRASIDDARGIRINFSINNVGISYFF